MTFDCDICGKACATRQGLNVHRGSKVCLTKAPEGSTASNSNQPQQSVTEEEAKDSAIRFVDSELEKINDNRGLVEVERFDGRSDKLIGTIKGPMGTAYEGGVFTMDVDIPSTYPFKPPKIHFTTKIWHPNVELATGQISGELFEKDWTAAMTLRGLLMSVHALLITPVMNDDAVSDSAAAVQFSANRNLFDRTARYWAQVYARAPGTEPDLNNKVASMVDMGFGHAAALHALSEAWWNADQAIQNLALIPQTIRRSCCNLLPPTQRVPDIHF